MKYIIMCGGTYTYMKTPKQLLKVNGERLVERTIRLLKENGVDNIAISSNDSRFNNLGVEVIHHENNYKLNEEGNTGYWLSAFYPSDEAVTYLYGDVYYSDKAIRTIINSKTDSVLFFGSRYYKDNSLYFKEWEEPFGFKVVNQHIFRCCIEVCKEFKDKGLTKREPVSWELYRVLQGYDINKHIIGTNYIAIDDYTTDIDHLEDIKELEKILNEILNT